MKELQITEDTLPNAYHHALYLLNSSGEITDCPDWNTRQKEVSMTMEVLSPLKEPMITRLAPCGAYELEQYREEMLDGILDFEIARGNWTYTYHDRMVRYPTSRGVVDQVQFVIDELRRNPESRRAVIVIRDVGVDAGSDDPACLQHIQYFIRNNRLYCKVLFRSNDAVNATFMNAFTLIMLQKKIAEDLGVEMGSYVHRANSFHAYEHSWPILNSYCKRMENHGELTYFYKGDWDEQMEEAKDVVAELTERLRNK